ncbi:MAG: hypothetical protein JWQ04_3236 [Pedosphaera sp.]|nr:hypothetical protein [Pedosphaera sp.]
MKLLPGLICAAVFWAGAALARSPVALAIDTHVPGAAIPTDFIGLSFGMKALLADKAGGHFFSATNTQLITLFQNIGVRHLRVGGTTVESPPATPIPDETDIDNLFAFARAAGVKKIIYSLRLLETDPALQYAQTNAAIAKYIWSHYQPCLESFALGNEPDLRRVYDQDWGITNFGTYLIKWGKFAAAITNAVPEAKFAGPDGGSGNIDWTTRFARAEKNSGLVTVVTEHYYAGGKGRGVEPGEGIETMLSPAWINNYQKLYDQMAAVVMADGLPFRFTEANDHYSGGIPDASDTFAGALWALDFLHWWAAHDTKGVDFHNTQWVVNDVITRDAAGQVTINPKGYGLKAFDLGGHGNVASVAISNPDGVNLTAYAVRDGGIFFVTIINKDHGTSARAAEVTIKLNGVAKSVAAIFFTASNGDVASKTGVTLGGATITNDAPWLGKWTPLALDKAGQCVVKVAAASAVVVKISAE